MSKKSTYLFAVVAVVIAGALLFTAMQSNPYAELDVIANEHPEWKEFVDVIKEVSEKEVEAEKQVEHTLELGLAWKSLADRTRDTAHYKKALESYKKGIELSSRQNTVLLNNAGNMSVYIGEYGQAAEYYEESISVAPGDSEPYERLARVHEEFLGSSPEEIIAIFDQGIARMLNTEILEQRKRMYVERSDSIPEDN